METFHKDGTLSSFSMLCFLEDMQDLRKVLIIKTSEGNGFPILVEESCAHG